ncbi:MAG: FG-GAP-like repeat-containing protein [Rhodothermales bacterium]|nr:FG-GAP-like repeat-containing protein [Rhodothermales bacterium]
MPLVIRCSWIVFLGVLLGVVPPEAAAQAFTFTMVEADLPAFSHGAHAWADLDGDGDFDVVVAGNAEDALPFGPTTLIALTGQEVASVPGNPITRRLEFDARPVPTPVWLPAVDWADYDGDGDLDFVLAGTSRTGATFDAGGAFDALARLYRNDGGGAFTEVDPGLGGVYSASAAWGDVDNDGDPDLLLAGNGPDEAPATILYRNDGGAFTAAEVAFQPVAFGDAAWGDYDGDGDLDLALSGARGDGRFVTRLYRNDSPGGPRLDIVFTEIDAGLPGLAFSSLDWGDYDGDGDLDLALSGGRLGLPGFVEGVAHVYRNDGGTFSRLPDPLQGVFYSSTQWGDYDADGDLDLLMAGAPALLGPRVTRVYRNDAGDGAGGAFTYNIALAGVYAAAARWGDYDGDGDLDLLTTGLDFALSPLTRLYRNDTRLVNTPPAPPSGLRASVQRSAATLAWDAATDDHTAAPALTYNLRVGTASGAADVVAPLAAPSGRRLVARRGNVDHNLGWTLYGLPAGTYFWSVQAVDAGFLGSAFAAEGTFTIGSGTSEDVGTDAEASVLPTEVALHPGFPNPFRDRVTVRYDLPEAGPATLSVYNLLGAEVARLLDGVQPAGRLHVAWDGRDDAGRRLGAGVYFVRLRAGAALRTQKLILLK